MKTKKGKSSYLLPAIGQINSISLEDSSQNMSFAVSQVRPEDLEIMRGRSGALLGRICYAALLSVGYTSKLHVFPAPDKGGQNLRVRYFPPEREA